MYVLINLAVCIDEFVCVFRSGVQLPSYKDAVCSCLLPRSSKQQMQLTSQIDHEIDKQAAYLAKQVCSIDISISSVQVHIAPFSLFSTHIVIPPPSSREQQHVFLCTRWIICCMSLTFPLSHHSSPAMGFRHLSELIFWWWISFVITYWGNNVFCFSNIIWWQWRVLLSVYC